MPQFDPFSPVDWFSLEAARRRRGYRRGASFAPLAAQAAAIIRAYSGSLYLPNDANCFQDSAGTTAGAKDAVVGLLIDQAQGGLGALGPELVTNGGFDSDITGYAAINSATLSYSAGALRVTYVSPNPGFRQTLALTPKRLYEINVSVVEINGGGTIAMYLGGSSVKNITTPGTYTLYGVTASDSVIEMVAFGNTGYIEYDNLSVREVPGIHATQGTTGYKPILRKGAKNLILQSQTFNTTSWAKDAGYAVTADAAVAPDGTTTADKLDNTGGTSATSMSQSFSAAGSLTYTFSVYLKADTPHVCTLRVAGIDADVSVTTEWQRFSIQRTPAAGTTYVVIYPAKRAVATDVCYAWGAQLEVGSTASTYVATTTAPASNGIGPWWLDYDGSDDVLAAGAFGAGFAASTLVRSNYGAVQTTTTAQDLSAGYNMTTANSGLIVVPDTVSAADLAVLQRYANSLGGYSA